MTAPVYCTPVRIACKLLLVAVLVTAAVGGATGSAAAEPIDGKGNDVCPCGLADYRLGSERQSTVEDAHGPRIALIDGTPTAGPSRVGSSAASRA